MAEFYKVVIPLLGSQNLEIKMMASFIASQTASSVDTNERLLSMNHILKDFLHIKPIVKLNALNLLPYLYSEDVREIQFNTLSKLALEKSLLIKRAALLGMHRFYLSDRSEGMKEAILCFLQSQFDAHCCVKGLAIRLYFDVRSLGRWHAKPP